MLILSTWLYQGTPVAGLTPVITIVDANADTQIIQTTMTGLTSLPGTYKYNFLAYDVSIDYAIQADAGITLVDNRYLYASGNNELDLSQNVWSLTASGTQSYGQLLLFIWKMTQGRWRIGMSNDIPPVAQMYFYDTDNITILAAYNLKDLNGISSLLDILERSPI